MRYPFFLFLQRLIRSPLRSEQKYILQKSTTQEIYFCCCSSQHDVEKNVSLFYGYPVWQFFFWYSCRHTYNFFSNFASNAIILFPVLCTGNKEWLGRKPNTALTTCYKAPHTRLCKNNRKKKRINGLNKCQSFWSQTEQHKTYKKNEQKKRQRQRYKQNWVFQFSTIWMLSLFVGCPCHTFFWIWILIEVFRAIVHCCCFAFSSACVHTEIEIRVFMMSYAEFLLLLSLPDCLLYILFSYCQCKLVKFIPLIF